MEQNEVPHPVPLEVTLKDKITLSKDSLNENIERGYF